MHEGETTLVCHVRGPLVDGQGVFVCPDCSWVGAAGDDGWERLPTDDRRAVEAASDRRRESRPVAVSGDKRTATTP